MLYHLRSIYVEINEQEARYQLIFIKQIQNYNEISSIKSCYKGLIIKLKINYGLVLYKREVTIQINGGKMQLSLSLLTSLPGEYFYMIHFFIVKYCASPVLIPRACLTNSSPPLTNVLWYVFQLVFYMHGKDKPLHTTQIKTDVMILHSMIIRIFFI